MKVLLATNQLRERAGSELYVLELASALTERGAQVAIFTFFPGPLSRQFSASSGIRIFGPGAIDDVKRFAPDIAHTHHVTTFHLVGDLLPGVPRVHGLLGVLPDLEQVPASIAEASRVVVVSERLRDVALSRSAAPFRIELVRNWFDDRVLAEIAPYTAPDDVRHKVLVVSNNESAERDAALDQLQGEGLVSWMRVGRGHQPRDVTADFLRGFDLVVTMGRTVLLAGAVGVPCVVADQHLSDGLLTHEIVDDLAAFNFTGRVFRRSITAEHLRGEILRSKRIDREALSRKIRAEYGLSSRARIFLSMYDAVLAEPRPPLSPTIRRGEGMVYRDLALRILSLEAKLKRARALRMPASSRLLIGLRRTARQLAARIGGSRRP